MEAALFRETAVEQIIRFVTKNRILRYPEEEPGFVCPSCYDSGSNSLEKKLTQIIETSSMTPTPATERTSEEAAEPREDVLDLEKQETIIENQADQRGSEAVTVHRTKTREETLPFSEERFDVERAAAATRSASLPIQAAVTNQGEILVDWCTTGDPANPQN